MPKFFRTKMTPREKKEQEELERKTESQDAKIDYIAMMTDVEIPEEEDTNEQEV